MSDGVSKRCDLSQNLPIAVATISNIPIKLLQSKRKGEHECTYPLCKAFLCDHKMRVTQVSEKGDAFWRGMVVRRLWSSIITVLGTCTQVRCSIYCYKGPSA